MIKKVTNGLDLRREILDWKYELDSRLIKRSACSTATEEEKEKLLIKYYEEGDQLNDEVNFHTIKYLFMICSTY